ncbi:MAG: ABC transporter permease subunit, partial [Hungatella sp.]
MRQFNIKKKNRDLAAIDGRRFGLDQAMTGLSFVLLAIIVVIPVFMIVYHAFFYEGKFSPELFSSQLLNKDNLASMWNTIKIAFWVTILGTIVGVFYAWLLGRSDIPAKGLMRALFNIPYMFPPFLGAMAWDLLLNGRSGYLNRWLMDVFNLQRAPININSLGGIIFVELSYYFPFVFMQVVSALERMDPTLEESARIAGAKQLTVIRKITLPLVLPAISAGALLILISSLAHFGVPSILGFSQGIYTLPTRIYAVISRSGGSFEGIRQGAALSIMLVVVVAAALFVQKKVLSSGSYDIIKGKSMRPTLIKLRKAKVPLFVLSVAT